MPKPKQQPSELELQILSVLWDRGPSTVREILEAMPDKKQRAYTSVLSVIQVMEKKGLVAHSRVPDSLAHVYRARTTRRQVLGPWLRGMVTKVFGGDPTAAVQQLLTETEVDRTQIQELRRFLDDLEQEDKTR